MRKELITVKKLACLTALMIAVTLSVTGCRPASSAKKISLDPQNPVTVTVWHYYNGALLNAFDDMVRNFNETVGKQEGVIVEASNQGNTAELEKAVISAVNKEVGSGNVPHIFASYADTAYAMEKLGLLAALDDYLTDGDLGEYIDSYITEGKIGLNGEFRIFPIAKATETFMLNETDWLPFAAATGVGYDDLKTMEGITRVSELYYHWCGKAFFGRDSMANFFIIASKEFGTEIFEVEKGKVKINVKEDVMRKIWDNYYIPYISGYFSAYGRFRSDDVRVGDILAYIGSTSSAAYFPNEVTADGETYPINAKVLPLPHFEGRSRVMVQQGAGMVVTKSTQQLEYASIVFLKWFTEQQNNIEFSALSGYMPVKKSAADYDLFVKALESKGQKLDKVTSDTLSVAFSEIKTSELYTNKAFDGGAAARSVLEQLLQDKAGTDREAVAEALGNGMALGQALAPFKTEENFQAWLDDLIEKLNEAVS
jgi:multiple sugar transport system substrate-binding protein